MYKYLPLLIVLLSCSSCIEIIDDVKINLDGSGTIKYTLNLSSSKTKVNSILALDSLDGKKMPNIEEVKKKIDRFENLLSLQNGISDVSIEKNYEQFVFKLKCDFKNIKTLQNSLKIVFNELSKDESVTNSNFEWLSWKDGQLERKIPEISRKQVAKIPKKDIELLRNGKYVSITRFDNEIKSTLNSQSKLSKSKKAVMLKTNPYILIHKPKAIDNLITLKKRINK